MSTSPHILVFCPDLLFAGQIHAAIQRAGLVGRTCLSQKSVESQLASLPPGGGIIVDLEIPALDLPALRAAAPQARIIAFGPHVHDQLLAAAREAGCDVVLTRGQVAGQLESILANVPPG